MIWYELINEIAVSFENSRIAFDTVAHLLLFKLNSGESPERTLLIPRLELSHSASREMNALSEQSRNFLRHNPSGKLGARQLE
jgi:hypothetical protein